MAVLVVWLATNIIAFIFESSGVVSVEVASVVVPATLPTSNKGVGETEGQLTARTSCGRLVHVNGGRELISTFADAEITASTTWSLTGKLINEDSGEGV